jgi:hypothetical protein
MAGYGVTTYWFIKTLSYVVCDYFQKQRNRGVDNKAFGPIVKLSSIPSKSTDMNKTQYHSAS